LAKKARPESKLVHNESLKLAAGFLSNLGVAAFATGAIIPSISTGPASESVFHNFLGRRDHRNCLFIFGVPFAWRAEEIMKRPLTSVKEMMRRANKVRRSGTVAVQVDIPVDVYDALS
jgi:hypothetical protein